MGQWAVVRVISERYGAAVVQAAQEPAHLGAGAVAGVCTCSLPGAFGCRLVLHAPIYVVGTGGAGCVDRLGVIFVARHQATSQSLRDALSCGSHDTYAVCAGSYADGG